MAEKCFEGAGGFGRPRRALTVLALTFLASGCYTYAEVAPAAVPPGSSVRLRVDPRVQLSAGETPLPGGERLISGTLVQGSSADTLFCSVLLGNGDPRTPMRRLRGTVAIPIADVERLEVRRLQKGRTAAVVGAGALVGFAVLQWAFDVTNANKEGGDDPGGVNNTVVLFRLRW